MDFVISVPITYCFEGRLGPPLTNLIPPGQSNHLFWPLLKLKVIFMCAWIFWLHGTCWLIYLPMCWVNKQDVSLFICLAINIATLINLLREIL